MSCSGTFTITVKRAGLASSWLHDHMAPGKTLLFRGIQVKALARCLPLLLHHVARRN